MTKQEIINSLVPSRVAEDLNTPIEIRRARLKAEFDFLDREERLRDKDLANMIAENRSEGRVGRSNMINSYLVYLLGLTTAPPDFNKDFAFRIDYFLTRFSDPDIDCDFEDNTLIYDYIINKYGKERVTNIGTYNEWKVRAAVQNACKYLRIQLAGMTIPETAIAISATIDSRAENFELAIAGPECQQYVQQFPELFEAAKAILNLKSHVGKHAAGIVISDVPMVEYTPVHRAPEKEDLVSQYDMNDMEALGLLKMDILGLKTLKVIHMTVDAIKAIKGIDIHPWKIDPTDPKVFAMISKGITCGVFQFESYGMTKFLQQMRPSRFEDLVAATALFRPGPKDNGYHLEYIERKRDESKRHAPHSDLEKLLFKTFGLIVYQEQIMKAVEIIAGFTATEADEFRRIIGKKKKESLPAMAEKFVKRAVSHGLVNEEQALELWEQLAKFGSYCFNKCIAGDTTVFDKSTNSLVSIEDLYNRSDCGRGVVLDSYVDGKVAEDEVVEVFYTGDKDIYEVEFDNGMVVKATLDHKFLCTDEMFRTIGEVVDGGFALFSETTGCKVKSVKCLGPAPTYNLTMKSDQHNYRIQDANGRGLISANSHAVSYTLISYAVAAFKLYFPRMFYSALMSVELHFGGVESEENLARYEKEASHNFKIGFLPVDINKSQINYSIEGNDIRFPISSIKGIGSEAQKEICANQPFNNFEDFYSRCNTRVLTSAVMDALIENGAFSSFGTKGEIRNEHAYMKAKIAMSNKSSSRKSIVPNMKMLI